MKAHSPDKAERGREAGCKAADFGGRLEARALSDTGVSMPLEGPPPAPPSAPPLGPPILLL